ncbi:MAG: WD domain-containing protein, G-beta repeat-containing protein, partial [Candidatus Kentron sp. G]
MDANAEALRILTGRYTESLQVLSRLNANCDVNPDIFQRRSAKDFGWIYQSTLDTCDKDLNDLKDYARTLAQKLDEAAALQKEHKKHALAATNQLDRMNLLESAEGLIRIVKDAEKVREKSQKAVEGLMMAIASGRRLAGEEETVRATLEASPPVRTYLPAEAKIDYANWQQLRRIQAHSEEICYPHCIEFAPNGRTVLTGSWDNKLKLWEMVSRKTTRTFQEHSSKIWSIAFAPDGRTILSGSNDMTLKLWAVASGRAIRTFRGHSNTVRSVAFSSDGRTALSGGLNDIKLWDVASGEEIRTFPSADTQHSGWIRSVAFAPDGRTALSGSEDKTLKLWDVASGQEIRTFQGHSDGVWSVAFAPDGRAALSGSSDKTLKLWDVASVTARVISGVASHIQVEETEALHVSRIALMVRGYLRSECVKELLSQAQDSSLTHS